MKLLSIDKELIQACMNQVGDVALTEIIRAGEERERKNMLEKPSNYITAAELGHTKYTPEFVFECIRTMANFEPTITQTTFYGPAAIGSDIRQMLLEAGFKLTPEGANLIVSWE